ncbi:hypothetical protein TR51_06555 [Kitasatospora griseola]|uniref:Uncharacterized protein n=1 Tax=Kitasatospora griseola TaxID=2064 RepID=A0A0D0Q3A7_KITGR|nr:hypothetical protein [Kitasatospora griseola]KIQ67042.1 hypothetical protein TR51_06555 [Kitasatospora griseola]
MTQPRLSALRPTYNGTALAAALAIGAPTWSHTLNSIATTGDGTGPLGATAIALALAALADRALYYRDRDGQRHDLWLPRAALFTAATAPLYNHHTGQLVLGFLTGGAA